MKKYLFIGILLFLEKNSVFAQDFILSQFYASPSHINPAFTGLTKQHRFSLNYRNHWPEISAGYKSYVAAYDLNLSEQNSGLGVQLHRDDAGIFLAQQGVNLGYAYNIKLTSRSNLRTGLNLGIGNQLVDKSKFSFPEDVYGIGGNDTEARISNTNIIYPDLGFGLLYHNQEFWIGAAVFHLNRPNLSITSVESPLASKYTIHFGYTFVVDGDIRTNDVATITPAINIRNQGKHTQVDLNLYYEYAPLVAGIGYRVNPSYGKYDKLVESVILIAGFQIPEYNLKIGYSYDISLSNFLGQKPYSHELSLVYEHYDETRKRALQTIPCPKF